MLLDCFLDQSRQLGGIPMIKAELHFFKVEIEVSAAHAVVTPELSLCITPEVLYAVNMLALARGEALLMIDPVMLETIEYQSIVRAETVGVDDALGNDLGTDDLSQSLARNIFNDTCINFTITFQKPENRHFPGCATSALAFAPTAEVRLVAFNLATKRARLFALTGEAAADDLVDALGAVAVDVHHLSGTTRRHFQREIADQLIKLPVRQLTVSN